MSTNKHRIAYIPSTDSLRPGLVVGVAPVPPTSLAQSGIVTDLCLAALSSIHPDLLPQLSSNFIGQQ